MTKVVVNFDFYIIQCTTSFNLAKQFTKKAKNIKNSYNFKKCRKFKLQVQIVTGSLCPIGLNIFVINFLYIHTDLGSKTITVLTFKNKNHSNT